MIRWFTENKVASNLLMIAIILGGLLSLPLLDREVMPGIPLDIINIDVEYPGAGPIEIEERICIRLEEAIHDLEGIKSIASEAVDGRGGVSVEIARGYDTQKMLGDIKARVDALDTLGLSSFDFLVLPRLLAVTLMMPLLVIYADLMGIIGGFIVGVTMLDLSAGEYLTTTWESVGLANMAIGIVHGTVFGVIVGLTGCYQGIRCGRSASSVGSATTAAVVNGIVLIIGSTAVITVICNVLGV